MPESLGRVVGIFLFIGLGMMTDMVAAPLEGRILQCPTARNKDTGLNPVRTFEALMRNQPVITDGDTHARNDVHHHEQDPVKKAESIVVPVEWDSDDGGGYDGTKENEVSRRKLIFGWCSFSRCREHYLSSGDTRISHFMSPSSWKDNTLPHHTEFPQMFQPNPESVA